MYHSHRWSEKGDYSWRHQGKLYIGAKIKAGLCCNVRSLPSEEGKESFQRGEETHAKVVMCKRRWHYSAHISVQLRKCIQS